MLGEIARPGTGRAGNGTVTVRGVVARDFGVKGGRLDLGVGQARLGLVTRAAATALAATAALATAAVIGHDDLLQAPVAGAGGAGQLHGLGRTGPGLRREVVGTAVHAAEGGLVGDEGLGHVAVLHLGRVEGIFDLGDRFVGRDRHPAVAVDADAGAGRVVLAVIAAGAELHGHVALHERIPVLRPVLQVQVGEDDRVAGRPRRDIDALHLDREDEGLGRIVSLGVGRRGDGHVGRTVALRGDQDGAVLHLRRSHGGVAGRGRDLGAVRAGLDRRKVVAVDQHFHALRRGDHQRGLRRIGLAVGHRDLGVHDRGAATAALAAVLILAAELGIDLDVEMEVGEAVDVADQVGTAVDPDGHLADIDGFRHAGFGERRHLHGAGDRHEDIVHGQPLVRGLVFAHRFGADGIVRENDFLQVAACRARIQVEAHGRLHGHRGAEGLLAGRHVAVGGQDVDLGERTLHRHAVARRRGSHVHEGVEGVQRSVVGLEAPLEGEAGHAVVAELDVIGAFAHREENDPVVLRLGQGQGHAGALGVQRHYGLESRPADAGGGQQLSAVLGERRHIELEFAGGIVEYRGLGRRLRQGTAQVKGKSHRDRPAILHRIGQRFLGAGRQCKRRKGGQQGIKNLFHFVFRLIIYFTSMSSVTTCRLPSGRLTTASMLCVPAVSVKDGPCTVAPSRRQTTLV